MTITQRIIAEDELSRFLDPKSAGNFVARVNALVEHQKQSWPMLKEGYEAFAKIETKRLQIEEAALVIQHNPKRIRSTAAYVDKASVEARRCFLCMENLPAEEKGVCYGGGLIIFCNPFPVLDKHLSIVHRDHIEQKIEGNVETLLSLTRDLSPDYFVLYNGPECGASAPDHLHFQACSRTLLPIEEDAGAGDFMPVSDCQHCREAGAGGFELFTLADCGRSVIVFRGTGIGELTDWVYRTLDELSIETGKAEPMVNIICTHDRGVWTVYLFPRARHRPACFFEEGEARLTISPGAIDMAGVVVVPEREHFVKIGPDQVETIFSEVSLNIEIVDQIVERLTVSQAAEEF